MATNQILHAVDEIIDGTPKYNITDNGDGTKGIELANEVAQQGTALNKACLDKIDNVLSYLTPSVEKILSQVPATFKYYLELPSSVSGKTINAIAKNDIDEDTIPVTFKATGTDISQGYRIANNTQRYYITIGPNITDINNNFKNGNMVSFTPYTEYNTYSHDIIIDLTNKTNIKLDFNIQYGVEISYSLDGVNYTLLETIGSSQVEKIIDIPNNSYLKIHSTIGQMAVKRLHLLIDGYKTTYQNQFTLDNNTSFTNNQRVLIEPHNFQTRVVTKENYAPNSINETISQGLNTNELNANYELLENGYGAKFNIWTDSPTGLFISPSANGVRLISQYNGSWDYTNSNWISNFSRISKSSSYSITFAFERVGNYTAYIDYDFGFNASGKYKYNINYTNTMSEIALYGSIDGINFTKISNITNNNDSFITFENYRYIRLKAKSSGGDERVDIYYAIFDIDYLLTKEFPFENISSNTLNEIDIPTLLQPSTKYELIYKEDTNKFEFGNLTEKQPLFDITLTEAVNQVDLTGISDMLEDNKTYSLVISNSISDKSIQFGDNNIGNTSYYGNACMLFAKAINSNNNVYIFYRYGSGFSNSQINDYEYIKCITASNTFNAGTRIIIKEL